MKKPVVRLAEPSEAEVLTRLAMTAKASWGYSNAFMEACRAELTMTSHQNVGLDGLGGRYRWNHLRHDRCEFRAR